MRLQDLEAATVRPVALGLIDEAPERPEVSRAERISAAVAVAAAHAEAVDRDGRFPREALDAIRAGRLLGLFVPRERGGDGASIEEVAEICYALGQVCASTAMIFAMHQTKISCILRHGSGHPWHDRLLERLAREQLLFASSTTEGQKGGDVRSSQAAVDVVGDRIVLDRAATVISYGAHADGIVTTARRTADAAKTDQVLVVFLKEDYTLERLGGWDTLGMRGTCSSGFRLRASGSAEQILPERYETIHSHTMTPVSHILWSSAWAGIAAGAVARAQRFTRHAARAAGGQLPPGANHVGRAVSSLRALRALVAATIDRFEEASAGSRSLASIDFQSAIAMHKVEASDLAVETVMSAMRACGLAGYRQDGEFSIARQLRDVLSSPIMIHNDRIVANVQTAALMAGIPATLRA